MLTTQGNAAPASPSPHLADAHDSDFHAVLASYASAAQSEHQAVARSTQADKSLKVVDRARSSASDSKVSRKDARAEEKTAKKSGTVIGRPSVNTSPVVAVEPVRAPAPIRSAAASQHAANDDNEARVSDAHVIERAPRQPGTSPITNSTQQLKGMPALKSNLLSTAASGEQGGSAAERADEHQTSGTISRTSLPANEQRATMNAGDAPVRVSERVSTDLQDRASASAENTSAQTNESSATARSVPSSASEPRTPLDTLSASAQTSGRQVLKPDSNAPAKEIATRAVGDITAAARTDSGDVPANTAPESAANAAPRVVQMLASNVTAMLNAMRGAITVASPKQSVSTQTDVNPDIATSAKLVRSTDPVSTQQPVAASKPSPDAQTVRTARPVQDLPSTQNDARVATNVPKEQHQPTPAADVKSAAMTDIAPPDAARRGAAVAKQAPQNDIHDVTDESQEQNRPASGDAVKTMAAVTASMPSDASVTDASASSQASQISNRNAPSVSKGQNRPVSDDAGRTDVAKSCAALSDAVRTESVPTDSAPANPASQSAPASNQIAAVAMPNAVNSGTPAQASVAPHQPFAGAQDETAPNIPALAAAIAAKSLAGTKTFDIRMDPPELGRVDVHLSVDRDGKVQAMLSAEHPQTLALLQQDSHNLERALKDAGLDLSNNSLNFSLKGEGRQGDGGGASMARARSLPDAVVARAEAANASMSNYNHASGDGRLDIRV